MHGQEARHGRKGGDEQCRVCMQGSTWGEQNVEFTAVARSARPCMQCSGPGLDQNMIAAISHGRSRQHHLHLHLHLHASAEVLNKWRPPATGRVLPCRHACRHHDHDRRSAGGGARPVRPPAHYPALPACPWLSKMLCMCAALRCTALLLLRLLPPTPPAQNRRQV